MEKISITKIITNTFLIPWNNARLYSQALAVPIFIIVCIYGIWLAASQKSQALNLLFYVLYFISFAYLAIICHQLVLVESTPLKTIFAPGLKKLIRFIILLFIVYLLVQIVEMVAITIYINIFNTDTSGEIADAAIKQSKAANSENFEVAQYIAYIPSMYIFARLCLIFPAIALGYTPSINWSWHATRRNHLHIFFIVALFPWALQIVIYALYRENATLYEQALFTLLTYISAALGVIAISLTYKELYRIEKSTGPDSKE